MLLRWICVALGAVAGAAAQSASGARVLVVTPTGGGGEYSDYLDSLRARGFDLSVRGAGNASAALHGGDGARLYDHAVLLAPAARRLGAADAHGLVRFVDDGGNLVVAAGSDVSDTLRTLAAQFGVTFEARGSRVTDYGGADAHTVASARFADVPAVLGRQAAPVLFEGIGHRCAANALLTPVLRAPRTAFSAPAGDDVASGGALALVSVFQTRGNARVAFSGSAALFSNRLLRRGNRRFVDAVTQWTLQEKSVLRASPLRHALADGTRPEHYRVGSHARFEIDVAEFRGGAWHAFDADDVQLELAMLDPYVRATLNRTAHAGHATFHGALRLPDRYGTFTFRVNYKRPGLTSVDARDIVGIRPLRHDEYPRFLTAAYPYYAAALAMAAGFLALSAVWLWTGEPAAPAALRTGEPAAPARPRGRKQKTG
ncbi:oligosaccharyl transferase glycoprotein complex, beta subunit [Coemansia sp. RSA 2705]|nr:oligosaccharyl transferase glycoprotein complex, beta subunit [Coemansia sp. RSA 2705]